MRIVVGGETRKCGKTSLVCYILRTFGESQWLAVKVTPHHHPSSEGGDTARFREAGAAETALFEGSSGEALPLLKRKLTHYPNWIVESTSLAEFLDADLRLLVRAPEGSPVKEAAREGRFQPHAFVGARRLGDALPTFTPESLDLLNFLRSRWKAE